MTSLSSLPPDSSSSDSSPSLPFDPFSRLPTELVQHIVESTIPFGYYSSTYSERQRTLRSLCLVSRLFHQVAESILHEVVHVDRKKEFEVWRSAARLGRSTSLQSLISGLVPPNKVLPLLSGSPKLRMLVIGCNGGEVDVGLMSGLSALTSLRLAHVNITISRECMLPALTELQVREATFVDEIDEIFSPSSVPNLRVMALHRNRIPSRSVDKLLDHLVNQLDAIFLDLRAMDDISTEVLTKIDSKTLFDKRLRSFTIFNLLRMPRHMRLFGPGYQGLIIMPKDDLLEFEYALRVAPPPVPTLLYFPHVPVANYCKPVRIMEALEDIAETCEDRGIELVFEWEPNDWALDSGMSKDFLRRMKEKKGTH